MNWNQVNAVMLCNFAKNYSLVLQDEAEGFHWNNVQATPHPFLNYFLDSPVHELSHTSLMIISVLHILRSAQKEESYCMWPA